MLKTEYRNKINQGQKVFHRDYTDANRKGFQKLLHKIQDSNFTLRQIKNGCSTLFDKEFMKINYTNPHLTNNEIKQQLGTYFDTTKPERFVDDLEKS